MFLSLVKCNVKIWASCWNSNNQKKNTKEKNVCLCKCQLVHTPTYTTTKTHVNQPSMYSWKTNLNLVSKMIFTFPCAVPPSLHTCEPRDRQTETHTRNPNSRTQRLLELGGSGRSIRVELTAPVAVIWWLLSLKKNCLAASLLPPSLDVVQSSSALQRLSLTKQNRVQQQTN